MIKRILACIVFLLCIPVTIMCYFFVPLFSVVAVIVYVITGNDTEDILFLPMEWGVNFPYIFIDRILK